LQEGEFERVGGIKTIRVDVRLVTATNRDLKKEIEAGSFREDLYYRLNVVPIPLPPLRERRDDISRLAAFFLRRFNQRLNKQIDGIDQAAMAKLNGYAWPGNIRELENIIERAVLFADGRRIGVEDLSGEVLAVHRDSHADSVVADALRDQVAVGAEGLKEQVKAATNKLERELIHRALSETNGNVTHAARLLKISRKGLQLKMKELDLRGKSE